ncbi:MAG: tRNA pseudouridine(13) synthase TruD [Helicobacteraceae bacterium]|jgi:tRNA pseudouridine13 synthase|nr:tRNA pseudouridine(13) synthase TruD [Helicobacteraceae bacterium]
MEKRGFFLTHSPIRARFARGSKDFVVEEVPLYEPCGSGNHLFVRIRKKGISTWEAISALCERVGVKAREVGYAGLKDKQAMSVQTISLPAKFEDRIKGFDHPGVKILDTARHVNKLKIGHLKGNRFFVRLKKVGGVDAIKLNAAVEQLRLRGMPNFFGFQRFGRDGGNYKTARAFLDGAVKVRGKRMQTFLINALQSERFNAWLTRRLAIARLIDEFEPKEIAGELGIDSKIAYELKVQPHFFRIFSGDLMCHYPHGRLYYAEDTALESARFERRETAPTGLLSGYRAMSAAGYALGIESEFFEDIPASGDRRYAWVFPDVYSSGYKESEAHYEISFFLPKGSYATSFIEELIHDELTDTESELEE